VLSVCLFVCTFDSYCIVYAHTWLKFLSRIKSNQIKKIKAYTQTGLIGLLRPPHMHVAPPLIITEEELLDGFERQDKALDVLDEALGF
jgi:hypothetical protein